MKTLLVSMSTLLCSSLVDLSPEVLIVWNVGQGQWVTLSNLKSCIHFDTGGEHWNQSAIRKFCHKKRNVAYYSHTDSDHTSFRKIAKMVLPNWCDANWNSEIVDCGQSPAINWLSPCRLSMKSNRGSRVFQLTRKFLIAGDSTREMEKKWRWQLNTGAKILIAGHHGSNTSTSKYLLSHLPQLRMAISSSRKKRYGHPHAKVISRLRAQGVPLISTEDWGNIGFLGSLSAPSVQAPPRPRCFR